MLQHIDTWHLRLTRGLRVSNNMLILDSFRGRTLRAMDVNRDGKVEKQEFTSKFFEAVQDGIDYSEMSQEMSAHFLPMLQDEIHQILTRTCR